MSTTQNTITQPERDAWTVAYQFYAKHRSPKTDADYSAATDEMTRLDKEHNNPLLHELLLAAWCMIPDRRGDYQPHG